MPYKNTEHQKQAQRAHYKNNEVAYKTRAKDSRVALRDKINKIKEDKGCADCKLPYPYYVLHFDHLKGDIKVDSISRMIRMASKPAVMAEILKCDVVCANCHAIRTWKRLQVELSGPSGI